jgi:hypothetical protein
MYAALVHFGAPCSEIFLSSLQQSFQGDERLTDRLRTRGRNVEVFNARIGLASACVIPRLFLPLGILSINVSLTVFWYQSI